MQSKAIRKILDEQQINYSIKYDTMIVYGDLILSNIKDDISFPHEHLWVRGKVLIENCPHLTALPLEVIEADKIEIKSCQHLEQWPKKLYADNITLLLNSGKASLFESEIYSDTLISDHPAHSQDYTNIYSYLIKSDDPKNFLSFVSDSTGNIIWKLDSTMAMTLHEMGYLKDIRSPAEIGSYLREIGMLESNAKVFNHYDAKSLWESVENKQSTAASHHMNY